MAVVVEDPGGRVDAIIPAPSTSESRVAPSMLFTALAIRIARSCSGQLPRNGFRWIRRAAVPATIGAAKLVPVSVWPGHGNPFESIWMFVPGAATSGFSRSPIVDVGSTKLDDGP